MEQSEPARRGSGDVQTSPALLGRPLDFIHEDHLRERQICTMIDGLAAAASCDRQSALRVLNFLNEELNVHLSDETEVLFPLLARRCTNEDAIDSAIARIEADQREAVRLLPEVCTALAACLDNGSDLSVGERSILTRFAGHVRRHVVAGNAILLPIARARLTPDDLEMLSAQMRLRRGLPSGLGTSDAE